MVILHRENISLRNTRARTSPSPVPMEKSVRRGEHAAPHRICRWARDGSAGTSVLRRCLGAVQDARRNLWFYSSLFILSPTIASGVGRHGSGETDAGSESRPRRNAGDRWGHTVWLVRETPRFTCFVYFSCSHFDRRCIAPTRPERREVVGASKAVRVPERPKNQGSPYQQPRRSQRFCRTASFR